MGADTAAQAGTTAAMGIDTAAQAAPRLHPEVGTTSSPASHRERVPYALAARDLLRNTLLDAALEELRRRNWGEITMAEIALSAGVSRQTLYKEFGSREEFARALALRETDRFLICAEQAVRTHLDDPERALSAAFDVFLKAAAENPLVHATVSGGGAAELLALFTTQGKPLVELATERLAAVMMAGWPQVSTADAALLSECLVRLAISYAALPTDPSSMTATSVATLLGPYIERLLACAHAAQDEASP
jgi:AcrR family transcriptional regulator